MIRPSPLLVVIAVLASVVAAGWGLWCWLDLAPDATSRLRDDAYYEFVWAINVAEGRGPMVSDGVTTSGVQWLWSALLVPFARVAPWVAPWLGVALHVATALLWFAMPRDRVTGVCLGLCWLGHPLLMREAQNGQETALAVFLATSLCWLWRVRERWFLTLSVLTVLARSDLLGLVLAVSWCRHPRSWRLLLAPAMAFVVSSGLNLATGGGLLQDSGLPMAWLWHENLTAAWGFWSAQWWFTRPVLLGGPFALVSAFGFGFVAFLLVRPWWPVRWRVVPAALVGVAHALGIHDLAVAGWCALLLVLLPAARPRWPDCRLLAVVLGVAAIVGLHWAIRWYPRDYYLAPLAIAPFAALARFARYRLLLVVFAVLQVADSWRVTPEPLAGQAAMALAGRELHRVLPAGERVGCFNSGLVTYHADVTADADRRHGVVNLDGVVDHRSFAALRRYRLGQWLDQQGIRFVLDAEHQFSLDPSVPHACGRYFGDGFDPARDLVECARFVALDAAAESPPMRLYWRRGRGQRPPSWPPGLSPPAPTANAPPLVWAARAGETLVAVRNGRRETLQSVRVDTVVMLSPDPRVGQPDLRLVVEQE